MHTLDSNDLYDDHVLPIEAVGSTKVPCSIQGVTSAFAGGLLGYVFGFGRTLLTTRKMTTLHKAGMESGSTFAVFGGVYTAVSCFCSRIRQRDDFWNGGLAGCATGIVVSWKGGPVSALQSCIGIGVLSALFDVIGKEPAAEAAPLSIYTEAFVKAYARKGRKKGVTSGKVVQGKTGVRMKAVRCRPCKPGFWFLRVI